MKKKTSLGAWVFIWGGYKEDPIPLEKFIQRPARLNFDGIEVTAFPPHLDLNDKERRIEVKKMLDDNGLKISGVAPPPGRGILDFDKIMMMSGGP